MSSSVQRNAEQTKETILEAATQLFAAQGFKATSLQQVATSARVARGTPHYFFTSKQLLYQTVLERESRQAQEVISNAKALIDPKITQAAMLEALIDLYWQFLTTNSRFLRLLQWTALEQPYTIDKVQEHWHTILGAADLVTHLLPSEASEETAKQLTLSIIGMCTFTFFFGQMAAQPLGINTQDGHFLTTRKEHVKTQLKAMLANQHTTIKEESDG